MKRKIKIFIVLVSILSMGIVFVRTYDFKDKNDIAVFIDEEKKDEIPLKDTYIFDKAICDDEVSVSWNYKTWGLNINNLKKKVKCNLYFISDPIVDKIKTSLDTSGKCPSVNADGSVNVTSAESENSLLCSAPDNYGTSYYYRGNVSNNYVYFANFYWRIVRINGDGSIRIIYDGTVAHANGEASNDRIIGTSAFNEKSDDNAYVGYMYGTPGSATYEETHANINDSTIKKYIDSWYEENLKNTQYEQYIVDNIFFEDKSISKTKPDIYSNKGFGQEKTDYRWVHGPWDTQYNDNNNMTLKSSNALPLKYNIGLLNTDEVLLAGVYNSNNSKDYLSIEKNYWLLGAISFGISGIARVRYLTNGGYVASSEVSEERGVKPVINLKAGSLKMGDGSSTNPYRIS